MNPKYTIRNFRIFDEKGATIELAPVTFLTGCNSSGKSSITKSIHLFHDYLLKTQNKIHGNNEIAALEQTLDVLSSKTRLSGFISTLNKNANPDTDYMEFSYTKEVLGLDFLVTYYFQAETTPGGVSIGRFKDLVIEIQKPKGNVTFFQYSNGYLDLGSVETVFRDVLVLDSISERMASRRMANGFPVDWSFEDPLLDADSRLMMRYKKDDNNLYYSFSDAERHQDTIMAHIKSGITPEKYSKWKSSNKFIKDVHHLSILDAVNISNNDIIFSLPIVDIMRTVKKKDVSAYLLWKLQEYEIQYGSQVGGEFVEKIKQTISSLMDDYNHSLYDSFPDYYKQLEKNQLKCCRGDLSKRLRRATIFGPNADNMRNSLFGMYFISINERNYGDAGGFDGFDLDDVITRGFCKPENQDFFDIYSALFELSKIDNEQIVKDRIGQLPIFKMPHYDLLCDFVSALWENVVIDIPSQFQDIVVCPVHKAQTYRIYSFERFEKDDLSSMLMQYEEDAAVLERQGGLFNIPIDEYSLMKKTTDNKSTDSWDGGDFFLTCPSSNLSSSKHFERGSFLDKWVSRFGIADRVEIVSAPENVGVIIYLVRNVNSDESNGINKEVRMNIADEGYGITQLFSLLLQIEMNIMHSIVTGSTPKTMMVEEPEIHLHPNYQSLLCDMFFEANKEYGINFLIETHSEYLIRRSQVLVAEMCKEKGLTKQEDVDSNNPFRTFYVPKGGYTYDLQYSSNGKFIQLFGEGFCDEADKWSIRLFDLENE